MARSTLVPIPDDITIADLDRAFAHRTVRRPSVTTVRRAKRSKPGGPYRVTFSHAGGTYGELGRVLLTPTADGRSLRVRARDSAGRTYDGMLYGISALLVVVGIAQPPLDNWHFKTPLILLGIGLALGAFARVMTIVNRSSEKDQADEAAALAFDIARQARGSGLAVDGGDDQEATI